ncbi:MAG: hypothetical protein IPM70_18930 [Proteobacteria bacterium]|nr:hypothetical protein [Pseudomonadota bacterium]
MLLAALRRMQNSNDAVDSAAWRSCATRRLAQRSAIAHERIRLDIDALREVGALPPLNCERQLTEQYRRIKRPLVAFALGGANPDLQVNGSLIMVTSSFPAEGKTFTSLNLSVSLSLEKDASVLLVDADIANPRLSTFLARRGARGLFDALGQESLDAETLVVDTDIPGLSFLPPARQPMSHPSCSPASRMASLMASLVDNDPRRLVVLDSPPLLLTNESRELASVAGQVLLVVRAGVTPQESVRGSRGPHSGRQARGCRAQSGRSVLVGRQLLRIWSLWRLRRKAGAGDARLDVPHGAQRIGAWVWRRPCFVHRRLQRHRSSRI